MSSSRAMSSSFATSTEIIKWLGKHCYADHTEGVAVRTDLGCEHVCEDVVVSYRNVEKNTPIAFFKVIKARENSVHKLRLHE